MMMNTGDEMSKKGEKSYFSNLLHNLSDSCTKNISHCQTKHRSSSKDRGQEHKMFLQSSRNRNFSQCGIQNYLSESYFLCDGRKCLHKEWIFCSRQRYLKGQALTQGQGQVVESKLMKKSVK